MANNSNIARIASLPEPEPRKNKVIEPMTLDEVMTFAQIAVRSQYFNVKSIEEAAVKILLGKELGLSTYQAMMGVSVIQGRPSLSAGLVSSLVKQSGRYDYRVNEWTATSCKISFYQGGQLLGASVYTLEDAKRAQLVKPQSNWDKYPKSMLFARAITQGARAYTPDIFLGPIYTEDEIKDGVEVIDVAVEPPTESAIAEPAPKPKANAKPKVEATQAPVQAASEAIPDAEDVPWQEPDLSKPEQSAPVEMTSQAESYGELVSKIDKWADAAAQEFDKRGMNQLGHAGAVINVIYERMTSEGLVTGKATSYRPRVNEMAKVNSNWEQTLSMLKFAAGQIANEAGQGS